MLKRGQLFQGEILTVSPSFFEIHSHLIESMPVITIKTDIIKDAWNWWDACQHVSHGVDWGQRLDEKLRKRIYNKSQKTAYKFLIPYLRVYYKTHAAELKQALALGRQFFRDNGEKACKQMEKLTSYPLYRKKFTCFLTTFPRCPYSYTHGYIWLCALWPPKCYLGIFLHELLHFQFFAHYSQRPLVKKLSAEQFEYLKESLTFVLNFELKEFLCQSDRGYKPHQKMRAKLANFWQKNPNFAQLVDYGAGILLNDSQFDTI